MKKYKNILLTAIAVCLLTACGKKGDPIILPAAEDVISIGVDDGTAAVVSITPDFIDEFMRLLTDMEITNRQSVNDAPAADTYVAISLNSGDTVSTIFYYQENDTDYIEQPYQGIYRPDARLGEMITELLASVDGTAPFVSFQATVLEADDAQILVEPVEGSPELRSADKIYVSNKDGVAVQVGEIVEIEYNGDIMESYPAQLGEVYQITVVGQE